MKIVFLCGCLEPGRDGVGDYVRRLAVEVQQQGHLVQAIALKDYFTTAEIIESQQTPAGDLITLRLPAIEEAALRFERAKQWIDNFNPDWLSLQFVPFSFHPKGLPFQLIKRLVRLGQGRVWHLMIHELWLGMKSEASVKYVWWGKVQRYLIKLLIERLQPKIIHTQLPLYQAQLVKLGFDSYHLPLFSNIYNVQENYSSDMVDYTSNKYAKGISLIVFGTIHRGAPIHHFAQDAALFSRKNAVPVTLKIIGRCGDEQHHWCDVWKAVGLPVEVLGEQSPNVISRVLLESSLGIATTPALLLGKSGTAAAMREHGLPILCVSGPWHPRGVSSLVNTRGVLIYQEGNFETYLTEKPDTKIIRLSDVAKQLTESLLASM
ncbi:glycosyltransferase [Hymenobacter sp. BT188]|uniref:glycosyltransferase n=1 Tax=Hymenobacter sp. BT188 TaxID=2763504 RepID=UPI0016518736|nr:glycosyltransferase [Hymenobacter sp. BT188]MBC6609131.1 glycosyltransferase [Hymenobacter sp. BT188]